MIGLVLSFGDGWKIIGCQQEMTGNNILSRTCHQILSHNLQSQLSLERERVKGKLMDVRRKGYFGSEVKVKSSNHFVPVPKTWKDEGRGKLVDEIGMIYDVTQSGLNDAV